MAEFLLFGSVAFFVGAFIGYYLGRRHFAAAWLVTIFSVILMLVFLSSAFPAMIVAGRGAAVLELTALVFSVGLFVGNFRNNFRGL